MPAPRGHCPYRNGERDGVAAEAVQAHPAVEIEFASGAWLRLMAPTDGETVKAIIAALAKDWRR
jgi:hypothetical protein